MPKTENEEMITPEEGFYHHQKKIRQLSLYAGGLALLLVKKGILEESEIENLNKFIEGSENAH